MEISFLNIIKMKEEVGAPEAERFFTLLADFYHTDTQSAGSTWNSPAYTLEKDEAAEITHMEIFPPVTADGTAEDLRSVVPIIDDVAIEEYVSLSGRYESVMMPPVRNILNTSPLQRQPSIVWFGEPCVADPLRNTTLKSKRSIAVRTIAGDTSVTADYRIRVWGVLYKTESAVKKVFGESVYGIPSVILDANREKTIRFTKKAVSVSLTRFDQLSGGVKQEKPIIMPLFRYAYNAKPTTANVEYEFNYTAKDVANTWENLFFDLNEEEAVFIKGIGVKTVPNLKYLGIRIGDKRYPKPELFRVDCPSNPFNFGHAYPLFPRDMPIFLPLVTLPYGYLIHGEKGRIIVKDNGISIPANRIVAAMFGLHISL